MKLTIEDFKRLKRMKRKEWEGYWEYVEGINTSHDRIMMNCKNDETEYRVIDLLNTNDIVFTLSNALSDDWEEATLENCPVLKIQVEQGLVQL